MEHYFHSLWLAQDIPAPGEGAPAEAGATGADGGNGGGTGKAPAGGGEFILPMLALMIVAMLIFSIFGQRRERKKREAMNSSMRKHDKVQTVGGVIGTIVDLSDDTVGLKVDEASNTRITFARSAIQQVLESRFDGPKDDVKDAAK